MCIYCFTPRTILVYPDKKKEFVVIPSYRYYCDICDFYSDSLSTTKKHLILTHKVNFNNKFKLYSCPVHRLKMKILDKPIDNVQDKKNR